MGKFKIQKSDTVNQYFDVGNVVGGTGGLTSIAGTQIRPNVYITGASLGVGSILRQKGKGRFLVNDGTDTGVCTFTTVPPANLAAGQMSLAVDIATITGNLTSYAGGATTTAYVTFATSTLAGVRAPAAGDYIRGSAATGNVVVASYSTSNGGALGNAAVTVSSQSISNVSATAFTISTYAARVTNKFVIDSTSSKYIWSFGNPTSTTVRITGG